MIAVLTPIGRATAALLRLDDTERVTLRTSLMRQSGASPPGQVTIYDTRRLLVRTGT